MQFFFKMQHNKAKKKNKKTSTTPHIDLCNVYGFICLSIGIVMQKDHKETHN
jgi:hypothetical protein